MSGDVSSPPGGGRIRFKIHRLTRCSYAPSEQTEKTVDDVDISELPSVKPMVERWTTTGNLITNKSKSKTRLMTAKVPELQYLYRFPRGLLDMAVTTCL